ncbi:MAG: SusC/RagA family TonB-linked outer membrane protein [Chitinophagaceae bacterium]|nr:SusC/RagA family TonB-linked outer membrane protein [Chitinophagaceae bacterium]
MKMKRFLLLTCTAILLILHVAAQQKRNVSGNVTDESGNPLQGVSVAAKGGAPLTATDAEGKFSVSLTAAQTVLVFSYVGYITEEVTIGAQTAVAVALKPNIAESQEVVVTALGFAKQKRQLGFAVTEVKGADLARTNELNPVNALQGKVAGVNIDQTSGGVAGSAKILIRGNSTLSVNNQPIFVVDGVIMDNDAVDGNNRDFGNDLKNLNMEDFETVSILRGSAAAALYGSRAINGVVLITTKKGKARKGIGVNVSQAFNFQQPYRGLDLQNEFGGGTVGAFFTDTRDPGYKADEQWTTKVFPTNSDGQPYIDPQINRELENWGPRMLGQQVINYDGTMTTYSPQPDNYMQSFQTGKGYTTSISADGGTDKFTFRMGYTRNEASGINFGNNFLKNSFTLRATYNLTSFITIDASSDFASSRTVNPPNPGLNTFIWTFPRNYNTRYWMQRDKYTSALGGLPKPYDPAETNRVPGAQYWFDLYEKDYIQNEQLFRSRLSVTTRVNKWLSLITEGSLGNLYIKNEAKELGTGYNFSGTNNADGGKYGLGHSAKPTYFIKAIAQVNTSIAKDLTLSGYVGGEQQRYAQSYNYSETSGGLIFPNNYYIGNSRLPQSTSGGYRTRKVYNSVYASADLAYKNQLFLQATWRGDWSSALTYSDGSGNNFFNYPAASLAWVFTETFRLPQFISYGKLRTNIAALGGDIQTFILNQGYKLSGYSLGGGSNYPMLTASTDEDGRTFIVDRNIKPLRKITKEVGLEMSFFQNRVGFDFTLYRDNNYNQPIKIPAAPETGVNSILVNAGNIQNTGIEVALNLTPFSGKNFSWNSTITYSRNRNKIIELYGNTEYYALEAESGGGNDQIPFAKVGGTYGVIRTKIHSLAYQAYDNTGKPVDHPNNGLPVLSWRGDARTAFPARNNEWQDVGDINPDFRGGWNNTLRYKSFSLDFLLDAKIGGDMVMSTLRYGTHTGIFPSSLKGRDAEHGGIVWTSAYDNITYDDGIIPAGVFPDGQTITQADGSQADVGGMTFEEAYKAGYVEPTHLPQYMYRYGSWSTAVGDYWVVKNSWISLRQLGLSYTLPRELVARLRLNNASLSIVARDVLYLYNTLPNNINPASNPSSRTSVNRENGFIPPMTRSIGITLRAGF